jgi:hypothetical protein
MFIEERKRRMQYTEQCKKKIEGDYTIFLYKGEEIFRFNHLQTSMFVGKPGCMTVEEHEHSIELCLKDRFDGNWKGDILNPNRWKKFAEIPHSEIEKQLNLEANGVI